MARKRKKKNSRKQRKIQRQKQLRQQLLKSGISIKNKEESELYRDYTILENQRKERERQERLLYEKKEKQRQAKRDNAKKLHRNKVLALEDMGLSFARLLPESQTRKIKLDDIKNGNVNRETYPKLFEKYESQNAFTPFNFDTIYTLPDNMQFYVAYRDFSGNQNIKDIINEQRKKTNEQLLKELEHWNSTPQTYTGTSGTSSGSAGDCAVMIGDKGAVKHTQIDAITRNRSKATREHTGDFKGYQSIKLRTSVFNTDMSTREILIIATSIMPNVTEQDRKDFYIKLYNGLRHVPDIQNQLPKPK